MNLPRLLSAVAVTAVLAVVGGCSGSADPDPEAREGLRAAAAPLLAAHARLDEYEGAVAEGGDFARARALWPDVAASVGEAVGAFDAAAGTSVGPAQRSTLIGYAGGLATALSLWERVDAAIRSQGTTADRGDRIEAAREHMRYLDRLRSRAFGDQAAR